MITQALKAQLVAGFVVLLLLSASHDSFGQLSEASMTYYTSSSKNYLVEDGLIDRCVSTAFISNHGRLNIIPCSHAQSSHKVYLYEFDGFRSYRQHPGILPDSGQWAMVPTYVNSSGVAYGYALESSDDDKPIFKYFSLGTEDVEWDVLDAPKYNGTPVNIRSVREYQDDVYMMAQLPEHIFIYKLDADRTWELIVAVDASGGGGGLRFALTFLIEDGEVWTEAWDGTVYRIEISTGELTSIPGLDLKSARQNIMNRFLRLPDGPMLYAVPGKGKLFEVDLEGKRLLDYKPVWDKDPLLLTTSYSAFRDYLGHILIVRLDPSESLKGWLVDRYGIVHDYTPALEGIDPAIRGGFRTQTITSHDFTQGYFKAGNAFGVVEVTTRESVRAVPGIPTRGFFEDMDGNLVLRVTKRSQIFDGHTLLSAAIDTATCIKSWHPDASRVDLGEGFALLGSRGWGFLIYDIAQDTCKTFMPDSDVSRLSNLSNGSVFMMVDDRLCEFSINSGEVTPIVDTIFESFVNEVYASRNGKVYLATSEGLYMLNNDKRSLLPIALGGHKDEQQVLSIYEDNQNRLWLGTYGLGMKIYDPTTGDVRQITTDEGLSSDIVASTVEDVDGDVWVGTFNGITIYDQNVQLVGYLYEEGGLVDNECNRWSAFQVYDDQLFFGTPVGFSIIDPKAVKEEIRRSAERNIYITRVEINGQWLYTGDDHFKETISNTLVLPASDRSMRISYGLSNYSAPQASSYAYKLDLPSSNWNYVGGLHDLSLTNLPHGSYDVLIKGTDAQGREAVNVLRLSLEVKRFFYQSWWFYVLCSIPFIVFGILWIRRQQDERLKLETEVIKRTETIRQQTEELKELDKAKTKLYTNITHEFRTPLTVIRGLVDKVVEDEKAPELIKRNTDNLLDLVNQMLDLRKLESGNLQHEPVQDDIVAFLKYVGESFRSIAELRYQQFHFLSERKELVMDFDPEKLTRIISNLLSNALKFTPEGGDVYLQLDSSHTDALSIKVTDTGIGISEDQLPRIFDRFYQVDDSTTRRGEGTGIGLTLVSELVSLMNGSIDVFSTQGSGSTFIVTLPITREAAKAEKMLTAVPVGGIVYSSLPKSQDISENGIPGSDSRYRVLIVEDNPDVVHYIGGCLQDDYQLSVAMDGQEGIEKALTEIPDLIVSDVMMPIKDGFELCVTLKADERTSHVPIVLLTAKADHESRIEGLARGADAYLAKPFDKDELLLRIQKLIELRGALQQRYATAGKLLPTADKDVEIEDAFIIRLRETLMNNLSDEDFGIDELCSALHLGRTQVHNKVKALTGKSTSLFMRTLRLAEAKDLLGRKQFNVSQVAFEVGFSDPKYFAKVFKKEFGQTPTEFVRSSANTE